MRDEPQPVPRAAGGGLLLRPGRGDLAVLRRDGAGDPRDVVVRDERSQRRDEAAGAALDDPLALVVARVPDRAAIRDENQLATARHGAQSNRGAAARGRQRSLTKRRRDPRPSGPSPISTSSAIERMIAIPRPPSLSSASSSCAESSSTNPAPVVRDLDHEPVVLELEADVDLPVTVDVRVPDRVRARLGERELQVGDRRVRERPHARKPGQGEPRQRDVLRLGRNRQTNCSGGVDGAPICSRKPVHAVQSASDSTESSRSLRRIAA